MDRTTARKEFWTQRSKARSELDAARDTYSKVLHQQLNGSIDREIDVLAINLGGEGILVDDAIAAVLKESLERVAKTASRMGIDLMSHPQY